MLAYLLALAVGLGSFALYMAAFFFPEVHRKHDLVWSGVGMFYALVLWVCAGQIRGGLLLGELAGVALLGWLGWQTMHLRRQVVPLDERTPLPDSAEVKGALTKLASPDGVSRTVGQAKDWLQAMVSTATAAKPSKPVPREEDAPYVPLKPEDFGSAGRSLREQATQITNQVQSTLDEAQSDLSELTEAVESQIEAAVPEVSAEAEDDWETETPVAPKRVTPNIPKVARPAPQAVQPRARKEKSAIAQLPEKAVGVVGTFVAIGQGLFKKKESKPIYVRKEYREVSESAKERPVRQQTTTTEVTVVVEKVVETAEDWLDDATETTNRVTEAAVDASRDLGETVAERAADLIEETENWIDDITEAKTTSRDFGETVAERAADLVEETENWIDDATDAAIAATQNAVDAGQTVAESVTVKVADLADDAEDWFEEATDADMSESAHHDVTPPEAPPAELVDAAIADAEAKHIPTSPPAPDKDSESSTW